MEEEEQKVSEWHTGAVVADVVHCGDAKIMDASNMRGRRLRYTNFAKQLMGVEFDNDVGFGGTSTVVIPKFSDVLHKMYLEVTLPEVVLNRPLNATAVQSALNALTAAQNNITTLQDYNAIVLNACIVIQQELSLRNVSVASINNAINHYFTAVIDTNQYLTLQTAISALNPDILQNSDIKSFINTTSSDPSLTTPSKISLISSKIDSIRFYLRNVLRYYQSELSGALELYNEVNDDHYNFAWIPFIGHYVLESIEVKVGEQRMDIHQADWVHIWSQMSVSPLVREVYDSMVGNTPLLTAYNRNTKPSATLLLPLSFWFSRSSGLSLPLVSLRYSDVTVAVAWRPFAQCIRTDATADALTGLLNDGAQIRARLLVEYIELSAVERVRFAQNQMEYQMEQVQYNRFDGIVTADADLALDFHHCSKLIVWFVRLSDAPFLHDFSFNGADTVASAYLQVERVKRMDEQEGEYYNYVQPYETNITSLDTGLYTFSFSLHPMNVEQPSGAINFSKLRSAKLVLRLTDDVVAYMRSNGVSASIHVFSLSHNLLRVFGGKGGLVFSF